MRRIFLVSLLLFAGGCATSLNNRLPFSTFTGREVVLLRPCVLEEYVAPHPFMNGQIRSYWEDGKPTELVYDDRMFTSPAKRVKNYYNQEFSLYSASDYHNREFLLYESSYFEKYHLTNEEFVKNYGGPYRIYELPIGTKVFITRSYNYNGIDNIYQNSEGTVTIPGTDRRVTFKYTFVASSKSRGTTSENICRAPWEDESVPEERFVGSDGKRYKPGHSQK